MSWSLPISFNSTPCSSPPTRASKMLDASTLSLPKKLIFREDRLDDRLGYWEWRQRPNHFSISTLNSSCSAAPFLSPKLRFIMKVLRKHRTNVINSFSSSILADEQILQMVFCSLEQCVEQIDVIFSYKIQKMLLFCDLHCIVKKRRQRFNRAWS